MHTETDATVQRCDDLLSQLASAKKLNPKYLMEAKWKNVPYLGKPAVEIPYLGTDGCRLAIRYRLSIDGPDRFRWRRGDKEKRTTNKELILHCNHSKPNLDKKAPLDVRTHLAAKNAKRSGTRSTVRPLMIRDP